MKLGRVRGTVVATVKTEAMTGMKLLLVEPLTKMREPDGPCVVAADAVYQAGYGDLVYFVASREAAEAMEPRFVPVGYAIVGIVDLVDVSE
jgi:ethanolamine utilization protein EutN